ncbi:asparagine synthase (glutamine-hydrolyzing), partial [Patescibacteria group bacterium]|nr:asparagine synthase (glutamine-hydrolyzing) [Patescibacteria group bacterium]
MCGVFALVKTGEPSSVEIIEREVQTMHHRGPQAHGAVSVGLPWCSVQLGMSRLKIVDQSDLPVPFDFRENLGVVLAFNGEVYNWRDLRTELGGTPKGGWRTRCDAEVVAAAWRRYGVECLSRLNGMWGFVLVDVWRGEVFAARDRAGEKPLYFADRDGARYFSSEIKGLPVPLRPTVSIDVETLEFDFRDDTPFEEVYAVPPGTYMHTINGASWATHQWWELPVAEPREPTETLVSDLTDLIVDATRIRYVSEVPVAVQLSGGLDSAIVQAICRSDRLYCVDFPADGVDNLSNAQLAAHGPQVTPVTFTRDDLLRVLPDVAYHLDTPATWTAVCQWFLNQRIADDGNVVVMSGEGADELFGGYARYRVLYWGDRLRADPLLTEYGSLTARVLGAPEDEMARMLDRGGRPWTLAHAECLVRQYGGGVPGMVNRMARTDFYTTMQVLLRMADRMSAAFSLENRSPFLDYRVMELSSTIPVGLKITEHESKAILRRVAER